MSILALLDAVPMLAQMVESQTKEAINLNNRVIIEIHTADFCLTLGTSPT